MRWITLLHRTTIGTRGIKRRCFHHYRLHVEHITDTKTLVNPFIALKGPNLNLLTDVASKWQVYACDLLITGGSKQFLEATTALTTCGILCTRNGLLATIYVQ